MKKILLLLLIPALSITAQTRVLTLEETLRLGIENSKPLKISKAKLAGAEAKVTEVSAQMLPKLSLGASYTRLSDVPPFEVNVPISPVPIKIQDAILNNYNIRLSLQQPLFTGFRLPSLKSAAELNMKASESDYNNDANAAAMNIQEAFWNLYKTGKVLSLVEENIKQMETHLADTKKFLDNGLVTKNDYLKLEVQMANVKLLQIENSNARMISRAALNKLLGFSLGEETEISAPEITVDLSDLKYDPLLEEALSSRPELTSTKFRVSAGEQAVTAAKSLWFPSLYVFGDFYYNRPNQRILPAKDEFKDTWDVGVMLNWELWNWGYNSAVTSQAEQQLIQVQTASDQLKDNIELDVYRSFLKLKSEYDKVNVNKLSVQQAEENYRITSEKYNQQMATSTDLIDAEVSLLDAKTKLTNALVDFQIAKVSLEKSVGRKIY